MTLRRYDIAPEIALDADELVESFLRASGPGGQKVNKVETAVRLEFDVAGSPNLPEAVKARLAILAGRRMTRAGVLVIVAQEHRTQERNREAARARLFALIREAARPRRVRRPTAPTRASVERRLTAKSRRSAIKRDRSGGADD